MKPPNINPRSTLPLVRCAIYTRKSTEEGLEQAFNTLDAQRESGEAYINSQRGEGWTCLATRYDDGGYTGANTERPALQRLLADINAGKVDCVVVYKVDRLSRSLLDFARLMDTFEKHRVAFVSVTQQFNTSSSMGRLVLNVLLSFAQFEREIISERTRDKIAATRRKGKWAGGRAVLGYDVDQESSRLVVNEDEAVRVKAIFGLYLQHESLLPVVQELQRRGWKTKSRTNKQGCTSGGEAFGKTSLHRLLTHVIYTGKVKHKDEVHPGEHPALIDDDTFQKVQRLLASNGRSGGAAVRNEFGAVLKGLLRCVPCACAMTPSHTTRGEKRYRYYTCTNAQKRGHGTCPSKSIPAGEIERVVIGQIKGIGSDPDLVRQTINEARKAEEQRLLELEAERRILHKDLVRWQQDIKILSAQLAGGGDTSAAIGRLADLNERTEQARRRLEGVREQTEQVRSNLLSEDEAVTALSLFHPVWQTLSPREQARILQLLIERIDYDGAAGTVGITFHPTGIRSLAEQISNTQREIA